MSIPFVEKNYIKININDIKNETLIVSFQGFDSHTLNKTFNERKSLSEYGSDLSFYLDNFSKKYTNYNYILVKDPFQCWFMINFKKVLTCLNDKIKTIQHKRLIFIGESAGGTSAILFGNFLNPDIIYSFAPQINLLSKAIHHPNINHFSRIDIINKLVDRKNIFFDPITNIQPFKNKTVIFYCKDCKQDKIEIDTLLDDANLEIIKKEGTTHDIISSFGGKEQFKQFLNKIFNDIF